MTVVCKNRISEMKRPSDDYPRKFVPAEINFSDWYSIEPMFKDLLNRKLNSVEGLEQWLLDESELYSVLQEEGARRYVAMTCATDDKKAKEDFLQFVENIEPKAKTLGNELDRKFLNDSNLKNLDSRRYEVLIRDTKNHFEIFREKNVPLETEITKLSQEYQSLQGAMTVKFKGEERTMQQMAIFLEETDRETRKQSWELSADRRLQDKDKINELFDKLLKLRVEVAQNADFDNYIDFRFRQMGRFDYTPGDCFKFHDAVEKVVMAAYKKILSDRKEILGLGKLRPYDLSVDTYNRSPLRPFEKAEELSSGCRDIFHKVDPGLGDIFGTMINNGLLDLESRKGKAPGGYQVGLQEVRLPFIFMNAVGLNRDVIVLLHEGGHAFHMFAARDESLLNYRHAPMEFCEVASMSMELIGANYLEKFYNKAETARARKRHLEDILQVLPWIATIDAFQHWIYSHPEHTLEERTDYWLELFERFGGGVDYTGYEDTLKWLWQRQLHLFEVPFYYIEYGIAQLGALQVWHNSKSDLKKTITEYQNGLALGGSRPLPELFEAAGIKFDFSEATLKPLIDDVVGEIERLGEIEKGG